MTAVDGAESTRLGWDVFVAPELALAHRKMPPGESTRWNSRNAAGWSKKWNAEVVTTASNAPSSKGSCSPTPSLPASR